MCRARSQGIIISAFARPNGATIGPSLEKDVETGSWLWGRRLINPREHRFAFNRRALEWIFRVSEILAQLGLLSEGIEMKFVKGQRVKHPSKPEWGVGQVLEESSSAFVRIFFVGCGEKELSLLQVSPLLVSGPEADHPVLENLRASSPSSHAPYITLADQISNFLKLYPQGFYGERYLDQERDYKLKAHNLASNTLAPGELAELIQAERFADICRSALRVMNSTNLVFPNEKMSLSDGLANPLTQKAFALALDRLLHVNEPLQGRFDNFTTVLADINSAKWTIASYFPFIVHPGKYMFVKPTVTRCAAAISAFEIAYRPKPNWQTYAAVQSFSTYLYQALAELRPRDMIDVQSFMWCTAQDA